MDLQIAVIIINYKTPDMTIDCLTSIENEVNDNIQVLVIDNNSNDGSYEQIADTIIQNRWNTWCRLIKSKANGGFAAGNNIGIRAVNADAYILLNSDTVIFPGTITSLRDAIEKNPDVGLVAPQLEKINGEIDKNTFRNLTPVYELIRSACTGPITLLLNRFNVILIPKSEPFEPEWVGFACVIIRNEVIKQVGLLDEKYFMYFEDIDYCRRVRAKGWKILYWPDAKVIHFQGGSSGHTKKTNLQQRAPKYYYKARAYYFKKYYGYYGLIYANMFWYIGRSVSLFRQIFGKDFITSRKYEFIDIWTTMSLK